MNNLVNPSNISSSWSKDLVIAFIILMCCIGISLAWGHFPDDNILEAVFDDGFLAQD